MIDIIIQIFGYIGGVLVLLAWFLMKDHLKKALMINSAGNLLLMTNGILLAQYWLFFLNLIFILITAYHLLKGRKKK